MSKKVKALISEGSVLVGRYRLDAPRQDSPLAQVWIGHDLVLDRTVVIKVLHGDIAGDELVKQFHNEAISAARLSHPNIVPTFDAGTDQGTAFMVSGFIEGTSLSDVLKTGPLPVDITVCIGIQVADALEHAHQVDLVHRDVRPSRLLVVDDDYRVMLTDFGVATAVAGAVSETLSIDDIDLGDPRYLSPEQNNNGCVDARADIFAIGRLLHTVGCGQDHPTADCTTLPPPLVAILEQATATDASDRYPDATQVKADLEKLLATLNETSQSKGPRRLRIAPPVAPRSPQAFPSTGEDTAQHNAVPSFDSVDVQPPTATVPRTSAPAVPMAAPAHHRQERTRAEAVRLESVRRERRRRNITIAVVITAVIAAIVLGRLVSQMTSVPTPQQTTPEPVPIETMTASSFDPRGDGRESESQVAQAVDNDPATAWSTERYNTRAFGNLKDGVGLVLEPSGAGELKTLNVNSDGRGWAAQIYVADSPQATLDEWGLPVDTQSGLGSQATFDLHSANGSAVLLWITDLGSNNRLSVNEANITR